MAACVETTLAQCSWNASYPGPPSLDPGDWSLVLWKCPLPSTNSRFPVTSDDIDYARAPNTRQRTRPRIDRRDGSRGNPSVYTEREVDQVRVKSQRGPLVAIERVFPQTAQYSSSHGALVTLMNLARQH